MINSNKILFLLKKITLNTLLLLFTIIIIEALCSIIYSKIVPEEKQKNIEFLLNNNLDETNQIIIPHPYTLYANNPKYSNHGILQHNSYGHRSQEITIKRPQKTLRILVLGGSTTYGQGVEYSEESWPVLLQEKLKNKLGINVEVINAGLNYATSAELLSQYMFRDRFFDSQITIIHTGGNDSGPLMANNYKPDYTHFRRKEIVNGFTLRKFEKSLLESSFFKILYANWIDKIPQGGFTVEPDNMWTMSKEQVLNNVKKNKPIGFERNLSALVQNIKLENSTVILFPFYMAEKDVFKLLKPPYDFAKTSYDASITGLAKNTKVMYNLAKTENVFIAQLKPKSIPLEYFMDHCHLKKKGEEIKAEFMANYITHMIKNKNIKYLK